MIERPEYKQSLSYAEPLFYFVCVLTLCLALGCETAADAGPDDEIDATVDQSVNDGNVDLVPQPSIG